MNDKGLVGPCGYQTGVYFIRRCGKPGKFVCARCALPLCGEHARPLDTGMEAYCPRCDAELNRNDATFAEGSEDPSFAEEDYAAFDAVSDFDKNADLGHGYDS
ncbi:MAG: hypothetical protein PHE55_12260 [Methylococcaceae bacterium]|nr:hypothetical protein [Methylococcaceae bacterium]